MLGGLKFSQRLANDLLGKAGAFAALAGHVGGGSDFLVAAASFIDRIADLSVGNADTKTHIHRGDHRWLGSMGWSLMVMRMRVKELSVSVRLERPVVGFGLSPEAVYDGRPLLDAGRPAHPGIGISPPSGDHE